MLEDEVSLPPPEELERLQMLEDNLEAFKKEMEDPDLKIKRSKVPEVPC